MPAPVAAAPAAAEVGAERISWPAAPAPPESATTPARAWSFCSCLHLCKQTTGTGGAGGFACVARRGPSFRLLRQCRRQFAARPPHLHRAIAAARCDALAVGAGGDGVDPIGVA